MQTVQDRKDLAKKLRTEVEAGLLTNAEAISQHKKATGTFHSDAWVAWKYFGIRIATKRIR